MPGPFSLRGLQAVHQSRFASLDDEKVSVSLSSPPFLSPSSSSSIPVPTAVSQTQKPPAAASPSFPNHNSASPAQKSYRAEAHKAVKGAIASASQLYSETHISKHKLDEVRVGSFQRSHFYAQKVADVDMTDVSTQRVYTMDNASFKVPTQERKDEEYYPFIRDCREDSSISRQDSFTFVETAGQGAQWRYTVTKQSGKKGESAFNIVDMKADHNPLNDLVAFMRSCLVPEGFPANVSPSYTPYMQWRALKYLFGGAMSVFTTRSLLHSVGISRHGAATTAMAINWVIKDGAGRVGKLLSARHGKKFDYDMKQLRFMGDLLMELGAGVELATVAAPHCFLPLACAANIAKNVAAVASTSTRATIYKAFAQGENIGDVTAKGECISNIADLLGTGVGIFISKKNPSLMATFAVLSCGYLCCSYNEIKSVCLSTLNRARFKVAVQLFLETGRVPSLMEGNKQERIFTLPFSAVKPFSLGSSVNEAFHNPISFLNLQPLFQKEKYLVTYNPIRRQASAVLKEEAGSEDIVKATFHVVLLECIFNMNNTKHTDNEDFKRGFKPEIGIDATVRESCKAIPRLFESFRQSAISQGWVMGDSLLNPGDVRLLI